MMAFYNLTVPFATERSPNIINEPGIANLLIYVATPFNPCGLSAEIWQGSAEIIEKDQYNQNIRILRDISQEVGRITHFIIP